MWRDKMRAERKAAAAAAASGDGDSVASDASGDSNDGELDSDAEEEQVQSEIEALRLKKMREKKRKKKKERELAAKRRKRAAFGMDLNAIDVPDNDKIFSLATITNVGDLEAAREIDLEKVTDDQIMGGGDSDEEEDGLKMQMEKEDESGSDSEDENNYTLEEELDAAYNRYLSNTRDGMAKSGTKMAKRTKKLQKQKALEEAREDAEMVAGDAEGVSGDAKTYAQMLNSAKDSDDSDDDSDDYDSDVDGQVVRDGSDLLKKKKKPATKKKVEDEDSGDDSDSSEEKAAAEDEPANPLIFKLADDPASVKTSRWFSNPLFEKIENTARSASFAAERAANAEEDDDEEEDAVQNFDSDDEDERPTKKRKKQRHSRGSDDEDEEPMNADDIIASMPKTDKQKRHEKRLKSIERMERRNARREREAGMDGDFKVAPVSDDDDMSFDEGPGKKKLSEKEKKRQSDARALIKAGMGNVQGGKDDSGFEVVSQAPLPAIDTRKYDSENEDYDSDDYAKTLALGTMILRKSKEKAMVDASYNRYAWNDPGDLPDWFVDDENKHYRPQLHIPPALL
jgi:AdoMet-dependent rRNA methyltransferase SPB1